MSVTKESLHTLIEMVDTEEYNVLYQLLMKFVPIDIPSDDEIQALKVSHEQFKNGEYYSDSEIDWDNLDSLNLD